jgi:CBS domain-containing protein
MKKLIFNKDAKALTLVILFLLISLGVVAVLKSILINVDGATIIAFVLSPLVIYALTSGQLSEFTGPGGWGAKFREAATETVDPSQEAVELSISLMEVIPKGLPQELKDKIRGIHDGRPIVMTMTLGRVGFYNVDAVKEAIQTLSQFRNFKFVIFVDKENKLVGYMPSWALSGMLGSDQESANNFIGDINNGHVDKVQARLGVITERVTTDTTNAEALQKMEKLNIEALVVVDSKSEKVCGVVERDRILSRMLIALTKGTKK